MRRSRDPSQLLAKGARICTVTAKTSLQILLMFLARGDVICRPGIAWGRQREMLIGMMTFGLLGLVLEFWGDREASGSPWRGGDSEGGQVELTEVWRFVGPFFRPGVALIAMELLWFYAYVSRCYQTWSNETRLRPRQFYKRPGRFDETADDMQFLTQWKFLDLRGLGHLLGCPSLMEELKQHVASEGFGQMRWYGAQRQTTRHSDGFDGQSEVGPVVGKSRTLLRLGSLACGDGFLTFHFEKAGGRCGRLDLLLHHGDLVVMDRQIAGTLPNGFQRSQRLWVTHRAGGLLAKRCPKHLKTSDARSFITLVWTSRQCPAEILTLLARHFPTLETLKQPTGETSGWPMDPKELGDVRRFALMLSLWFLTLPAVATLASMLAPWVRFRIVFAVNGFTHMLASAVMAYIYHIEVAPNLFEMKARQREVGHSDEMQGFLQDHRGLERSFGACEDGQDIL
eukprot:symbB.v1.2.014139.t2/scaffold1026.1/size143273/5